MEICSVDVALEELSQQQQEEFPFRIIVEPAKKTPLVVLSLKYDNDMAYLLYAALTMCQDVIAGEHRIFSWVHQRLYLLLLT